MNVEDKTIGQDNKKRQASKLDRNPIKPSEIYRRVTDFYVRNFIVLIATKLIVIGLILRYIIIKSSLGEIGEKEALALLSSKDFVNGHFSTMRSGSSFGGSLETFFTAPITKFWGMTQSTAWIAPSLLLVITSVIFWRSFEHTPYKNTMRIVMACLWIFPSYIVISSTQATGHLASQMLLQVIIFATAYYAAHSLRNQKYFYGWAFACGIAFWVNPISLAVTTICLIWIFDSSPILKKQKLRGTVFFILGSSVLWIHIVNNLVTDRRLFKSQSGIDPRGDNTSNALSAFGKVFGSHTYAGQNIFGSDKPIIFLIMFGIIYLIIWIFVVFGVKQIDMKKTTDFAFLQASIFALWIIVIAIYAITDRKIDSEHLTSIAIPALFLIVNAAKTQVFKAVVIVGLLIFSISSIAASIGDISITNSESVAQAKSALKKYKISKAIATHTLAYPIDVASKDKIVVAPFDGNNFDKQRSKIVHKDVQAIVIQFESNSQNDTVLCVQSYFGKSFKQVNTKDLDIYIVDNDDRAKVWGAVQSCNGRID